MASYAFGFAKNIQPSRFKTHIAEPVVFIQAQAANILQRNPHITEELNVKSINTPTKYKLPSNHSEGTLPNTHSGHMIHNPTVAKIVRSKAFAE